MENTLKNEVAELMANLKRQMDYLTNSENEKHQIEIDIIRNTLRQLYDKVVLQDFNFQENAAPKTLIESDNEKIDEEISELLDNSDQEFKLLFEEKQTKIEPINSLFQFEESIESDENEPIISKSLNELIEIESTIQTEMDEPSELLEVENKIENEPEADVVKWSEETESTQAEDEILFVEANHVEAVAETQSSPKKPADRTLGEHTFHNPIDSLKKYIGINDKFQFINELFEGKMKFYNDTIAALDELSNFDEAKDLLNPLKSQLKWDEESKVYELFNIYINRRFFK